MKVAQQYIGTIFLLGMIFFGFSVYLAGAEIVPHRWPGPGFHWVTFLFLVLGIACFVIVGIVIATHEASRRSEILVKFGGIMASKSNPKAWACLGWIDENHFLGRTEDGGYFLFFAEKDTPFELSPAEARSIVLNNPEKIDPEALRGLPAT